MCGAPGRAYQKTSLKSKLHIEYAGTGKDWMDDPLTAKYVQSIIGHNLFGGPRLIVWDSFRSHISVSTKAEAKKLKVDMAVVPGCCTKFVQAPDVAWNKPFKDRIREMYDDWMLNGEKTFTSGGNMRAPPLQIFCEWIATAWASLDKEMIAKSFKSCGVSINTDGSEDGMISCFKEGRECADAFPILKKKWAEMETVNALEQEEIDLEEIYSASECDDDDDEIVLDSLVYDTYKLC
jgi:hypothetical protein